MIKENYIFEKSTAARKIQRMAMEVAEANIGEHELVLAGIRDNGFFIAEKVAGYLAKVFGGKITVVGLEMDKKNIENNLQKSAYDFKNKIVILIDDVANSGRTMLYAMQPILAHFPKKIQTLALVERTYKKFPVHVDFVGLSVSTTRDEFIEVLVESREVTGAVIRSVE